MLYIFDLDLTLICSRHRQATLPDGTLDLDHWIENNTPEKIMQDSLLPLGRQIREYLKQAPKHRTHIACTARFMQDADHDFLQAHGLEFDSILSRPAGCSDSDVTLKDRLLRDYAEEIRVPFARLMSYAHFWDDNEKIRKHFTTYGVSCYNPYKFNDRYSKENAA